MLTDILVQFMQAGLAAIALLTPMALGLFATTVALDFTWTSIQIVLKEGNNLWPTFVRRIIIYSLYLWVIKNYKFIIDKILNSFIKIGLVAGGNNITQGEATDPSYIIDLGFKMMDKIYSFRDLVKGGGIPDILDPTGTINALIAAAKGELTIAKLFPNLFFFVVSVFVFLAFFVIALQLFITWIETYLITSIAVMFMPCAIFRPFAFIAEKAIGAVIGAGVKLMMLIFVISISIPIPNMDS